MTHFKTSIVRIVVRLLLWCCNALLKMSNTRFSASHKCSILCIINGGVSLSSWYVLFLFIAYDVQDEGNKEESQNDDHCYVGAFFPNVKKNNQIKICLVR